MRKSVVKLYLEPALWVEVRRRAYDLGMTASAWMAMAAASQMDPRHPHIAVAFGDDPRVARRLASVRDVAEAMGAGVAGIPDIPAYPPGLMEEASVALDHDPDMGTQVAGIPPPVVTRPAFRPAPKPGAKKR